MRLFKASVSRASYERDLVMTLNYVPFSDIWLHAFLACYAIFEDDCISNIFCSVIHSTQQRYTLNALFSVELRHLQTSIRKNENKNYKLACVQFENDSHETVPRKWLINEKKCLWPPAGWAALIVPCNAMIEHQQGRNEIR